MSAGRILTLGFGNPFAGRKFLPTLGLGAAGVQTPEAPLTTAGGGRKYRGSRALSYEPVRKKWKKLDEIKQEIASQAEVLVEKERLSIEEARTKARQLLLLGKVVEKARVLESDLKEALERTSEVSELIATKRKLLHNETALLVILLASTEV